MRDMTKAAKRATRSELLEKSMTHAANRILKVITIDQLVSLFPALANDKEELMEQIHQKLVADLRLAMQTEFQRVVTQYQMPAHLKELDCLIEEAMQNESYYTDDDLTQMASPTFVPEQVVLSKSVPLKQRELERLQKEMHELETRNKQLQERLDYRRQCIDDLRRTMSQDQEEINRIFDQISGVPLERLIEIRDQLLHDDTTELSS